MATKTTRDGKQTIGGGGGGKLLNWRKNAAPGEPADWASVSPPKIWECIQSVTHAGGAVMFGVTSDGGAYSITVLYHDDKLKEYPHGKAECEETLDKLADWFSGGIPA